MTLGSLRKLTGHGLVLLAIVSGWILVMAGSARFLPLTENYLAIGPGRAMVDNLPEDAGLLKTSSRSMVVNMAGSDAGRLLYAAGAWVVLPALPNGCLAVRKEASPS